MNSPTPDYENDAEIREVLVDHYPSNRAIQLLERNLQVDLSEDGYHTPKNLLSEKVIQQMSESTMNANIFHEESYDSGHDRDPSYSSIKGILVEDEQKLLNHRQTTLVSVPVFSERCLQSLLDDLGIPQQKTKNIVERVTRLVDQLHLDPVDLLLLVCFLLVLLTGAIGFYLFYFYADSV